MDRRHFLALSAGIICSPLYQSPVRSQPDTKSLWRASTPMPIQSQEIYGCVHESRLYFAGGIASKLGVPYFTNGCYGFDPLSESWAEVASLPEDLHHAALVSDGTNMYQLGGFNGGYTHIWRMRANCYRLSENSWVPAPDLPQPQAEGVVSCAADRALHIVAGQSPKGEANRSRSDHTEINSHWRWDTQTDHWEKAAPIPTPRNSATGGWIDNQLIISGGRTIKGNLATTEIYDQREDKWRQAAPMPLPQAGTASVVYGSNLIVLGGEIFIPEAGVFANVWRYDLKTDQWHALPDLITPRHGLGAGLIDNRLYAIGGATQPSGRGTSNINEVLNLNELELS